MSSGPFRPTSPGGASAKCTLGCSATDARSAVSVESRSPGPSDSPPRSTR